MQKNKDCSLRLPDGEEHAFSFDDIGTAIKWALENNIPCIHTPYGVLCLISKEEYDNVMYFASDGTN